MPNSKQNVQVSDTTDDASSTTAGNINKKWPLYSSHFMYKVIMQLCVTVNTV